MDQPTPSQRPSLHDAVQQTSEQVVPRPRVPLAPPMQIVTKGWWWRPDEEATVDQLEKADHG